MNALVIFICYDFKAFWREFSKIEFKLKKRPTLIPNLEFYLFISFYFILIRSPKSVADARLIASD